MADKGLHNLYTKEYHLHGILVYMHIFVGMFICVVSVPADPFI